MGESTGVGENAMVLFSLLAKLCAWDIRCILDHDDFSEAMDQGS